MRNMKMITKQHIPHEKMQVMAVINPDQPTPKITQKQHISTLSKNKQTYLNSLSLSQDKQHTSTDRN